MGIQGLLPFLKSIQRSSHIKDWAGQTLAIDAYVWLHRAAYGCAQELCLGIRTTKHIDYVMSRIDLLRRHGVIPYVVFDGDALPGKRGTEEQREKRRQQNLTLAQALLTSGKTEEAREAFAKAVDITPQLAHDVILSLEKAGVKYLVAPYEADAQLRFLERNGDVDGIITEDSDLLVYGARNVLFKLDPVGHCVHICRDDFGRVADTQMSLWTDHEFRQMAILSGCDYLPSIPGLGLKKAYQLIRTHKSAERSIKATRLEGSLKVPHGYEKLFHRAELTFLYQIVYNPQTLTLVHLHPLPSPAPTPEELQDCGEIWEDETATGVAQGRLDPSSKAEFRPSINTLPYALAMRNQPRPHRSENVQPRPKSIPVPKATPLPKNQRTLNSFAFTPSSAKAKAASSATPIGNRVTPQSTETPTTNSDTLPRQPSSKFFEPECTSADTVDPIRCMALASDHAPMLDELVAEDAEPLSQEAWSDFSEAGGSDDESMMGPNLPSSQMQANPADLLQGLAPPQGSQQFDSETSPLTSPVPAKIRDLGQSDGVISSPIRVETHETDCFNQPRITIIAGPRSSSASTLAKKTHQGMSSDPILDDEEHFFGGPGRAPSSLSLKRISKINTPLTVKKQRTRPAVVAEPAKEPAEDMSPSLARVASGMRERFMFRPPAHQRTPRSVSSASRATSKATSRLDCVTPTALPTARRRHTEHGRLSRHSLDGRSPSLLNNDLNDYQPTSPVETTPKLAAFLFKGVAPCGN